LLDNGIGEKTQLQFENIKKNLVKKSITFLLQAKKWRKKWTQYLKKLV